MAVVAAVVAVAVEVAAAVSEAVDSAVVDSAGAVVAGAAVGAVATATVSADMDATTAPAGAGLSARIDRDLIDRVTTHGPKRVRCVDQPTHLFCFQQSILA